MIDVKFKYQASIFLDAKDITPNTETVLTLVGQLKEHGFISGTFQEIMPPILHPQPRLRLMSQNEEWNIGIASQKIDIEKIPIDLKGDNLGELDVYCSEAMSFFAKIYEKYPKKAHRLALITTYLLGEMTEPKLSSINETLFNQPSFYKENPPFDWDWKSTARIEKEFAKLIEPLNIACILQRRKGDFQVKDQSMSFDRIFVTLDINTVSTTSECRFEFPHVKAFYDIAQVMHSDLLKSITEFISV
ncbi:MAG: hypothetical protein ABR951_10485 [Candidatus Aminicenantales bacterium]|jgi:hypothetical protein